jgi:hypothetical protein
MTDYRATPAAWEWLEQFASDPRDIATTILELRARVEALETNSSARLTGSNYPEKPDSSLVERVADAINSEAGSCFATIEARAAIREVAAWLREHGRGPYPHIWLVEMLEQEAER